MGANSKIEWCDYTFNPWWGCQRVSPGCEHCYAETFAHRFGYGSTTPAIWGPPSTTSRRKFDARHWNEPLRWNEHARRDGVRRRVFCSSMADVFEDAGESLDRERRRLWALVFQTPWLDWLLLTKRPRNIMGMVPSEWHGQWPSNAWLGITVEHQAAADERIPYLIKVPADVLFLSCEPLLGPVDLSRWQIRPDPLAERGTGELTMAAIANAYIRTARYPAIDWVIAGGESGHGARPMHPDWARSLRDQCQAAGVAYFFKQWGEWAPQDVANSERAARTAMYLAIDGSTRAASWGTRNGAVTVQRVGAKQTGRSLDGRTWDEFPSPCVGVAS